MKNLRNFAIIAISLFAAAFLSTSCSEDSFHGENEIITIQKPGENGSEILLDGIVDATTIEVSSESDVNSLEIITNVKSAARIELTTNGVKSTVEVRSTLVNNREVTFPNGEFLSSKKLDVSVDIEKGRTSVGHKVETIEGKEVTYLTTTQEGDCIFSINNTINGSSKFVSARNDETLKVKIKDDGNISEKEMPSVASISLNPTSSYFIPTSIDENISTVNNGVKYVKAYFTAKFIDVRQSKKYSKDMEMEATREGSIHINNTERLEEIVEVENWHWVPADAVIPEPEEKWEYLSSKETISFDNLTFVGTSLLEVTYKWTKGQENGTEVFSASQDWTLNQSIGNDVFGSHVFTKASENLNDISNGLIGYTIGTTSGTAKFWTNYKANIDVMVNGVSTSFPLSSMDFNFVNVVSKDLSNSTISGVEYTKKAHTVTVNANVGTFVLPMAATVNSFVAKEIVPVYEWKHRTKGKLLKVVATKSSVRKIEDLFNNVNLFFWEDGSYTYDINCKEILTDVAKASVIRRHNEINTVVFNVSGEIGVGVVEDITSGKHWKYDNCELIEHATSFVSCLIPFGVEPANGWYIGTYSIVQSDGSIIVNGKSYPASITGLEKVQIN